MTYFVKELFYTLQGEGANTGHPAIFCRFSGCNLWNGNENDRNKAMCKFCDTDFIGLNGVNGGRYESQELVFNSLSLIPKNASRDVLVVFTGGEPLLQLDKELIDSFHDAGFKIAVETNGSLDPPDDIDWMCVSPKVGSDLLIKKGNELKLVFPQEIDPSYFEKFSFDHFFLQPMDGLLKKENTKLAIQYCLSNPKWKLSIQSHKMIGIP